MALESSVYLALSINGAAYTVNAFMPARRNRLLFGWSFFASWITIELAWFHLLYQVLVTVLVGLTGGFRDTKGKVGLAITLASWAGLAVLVRDALGARREIADALAEIAAQPVPRKRLPVKVTRDVVFHHAEFRRVGLRGLRREAADIPAELRPLKLDVYSPVEPPAAGERRPVVMQIHGGGWVIGDKREQGLPLLRLLASQGWVGFNVNYRLSPGATFPDHLIDLKRAVAWIREHADEFGIDPSFIAVTGGSAGGHLTALMGLTAADPAFQPGFEDADCSVQAAVPFYGVYDFTNRNGNWPPDAISRFIEPVVMKKKIADDPEAFAQASPLDQVHADAAPFFVIHGDRDSLAPVEDAREFVARLDAVSNNPVHYLELHGAQHAFDVFPSMRCNRVIASVDQYLTHAYAEHRAQVHEPEPAPGPLSEVMA